MFESVEDQSLQRALDARRDFLSGLPREERDARGDGTIFTTFQKIWRPETVSIQDQWFNAIMRSTTTWQGNRLYADTRSIENLIHPMSQSDRSSVTNTTQQRPSRTDLFQNPTGDRARLGFSAAPECHKAYGYLAQAAVGIEVTSPIQRL